MLMWHRRVADAQHACTYGHLLLLQGLAKALQRKQASMAARQDRGVTECRIAAAQHACSYGQGQRAR